MRTISLARGVPDPELLPAAELQACAHAVLERDPARVLAYGPPAGDPRLRAAVAALHGVGPQRVLLANGSLQALALVAAELLRGRGRGRRVLVERPTYDRSLKLLAGLDAELVPVPVDAGGLDVGAVEDELARGPRPAFLYTIPTFQNPTGATLSLARRLLLAELARDRGLLVVEDDPYALVRLAGEPVPSLFELLEGDGVVHLSSFSKTIAPGLRVGYAVLPPELVDAVEARAASTYVSPGSLGQAVVAEFLDRAHLPAALERIRAGLRLRRDALLAALAEHLPDASWTAPQGGYFLWLELPGGIDARDLLPAAERRGVTFVPGSDFGGPRASARLAFSGAAPADVHAGAVRLAAALRDTPRRLPRAA